MSGRSRIETYLPAVLLLAATASLLRPVATGEVVPIWDADMHWAPTLSLISDFARSGRLLLWSPWTSGGVPFFAEPQMGAMSPFNYFAGLVLGGGFAGYGRFWAVVWCLAVLGMFRLGRHLQAPPAAAAVLAVNYLANGFLIGQAEHWPFLLVAASFPWILFLLDSALRTGRWRLAIASGVVWGLTALSGGYPGLTVASLLFLATWLTGFVAISHFPWPVPGQPALPRGDRCRRALAMGAVAAGVGMLIALPTVIVFLHECRGFTTRVDTLPKLRALTENALDPDAWVTLSSHYLAIFKAGHWIHTDISSVSLFVGAATVSLGLLALVVAPGVGTAWVMAMAALFYLVACGDRFPLREWLYDYVPPTRFFRHASLFRYYAMVALYVLASKTAYELSQYTRWRWRRIAVSTMAVGTALGAWLVFNAATDALPLLAEQRRPELELARRTLLVGFGGTALGLSLAAIGSRWLSGIAWLGMFAAAAFEASMVMTMSIGLYAVSGESALQRVRWLDDNHDPRLPHYGEEEERRPGLFNNDNLLVKKLELYNYTALGNQFYDRIIENEQLRGIAQGRFRVLFSPAAGVLRTARDDMSFTQWERGSATAGLRFALHTREQMLGDDLGAMPAPPADTGTATPASISNVNRTANTITFRVVVPADGWIMVPERWARSWRAYVDGVETPVWGAAFVYMALPLARGDHLIQLRFEPILSLAILAFTWLVIVAATIVAAWPHLGAVTAVFTAPSSRATPEAPRR